MGSGNNGIIAGAHFQHVCTYGWVTRTCFPVGIGAIHRVGGKYASFCSNDQTIVVLWMKEGPTYRHVREVTVDSRPGSSTIGAIPYIVHPVVGEYGNKEL